MSSEEVHFRAVGPRKRCRPENYNAGKVTARHVGPRLQFASTLPDRRVQARNEGLRVKYLISPGYSGCAGGASRPNLFSARRGGEVSGLRALDSSPPDPHPAAAARSAWGRHICMTYEYICEACGHAWEAQQTISSAPLTDCPSCGAARAKRQISLGGGFILKGGGWYSDLYGSSPKPAAPTDGGSTGAAATSAASVPPAATSATSAASAPAAAPTAPTASKPSTPKSE
jgi:putative FmdB family regulatory protein